MPHEAKRPWLSNKNLIPILNQFAAELYNQYRGQVVLDIGIFGGSALILKHPEIRRDTVDIDSFIKEIRTIHGFDIKYFIEQFAMNYGYVGDWMNDGVIFSSSFSMRMITDGLVYITTLCNCCNIYVVNDLDQLCMKAIASRNKDIKDINLLCKELKLQGCSFYNFETNLMNHFGRSTKEIPRGTLNLIKRKLST